MIIIRDRNGAHEIRRMRDYGKFKDENGKVKQPLKGATLIGNGPDAMSKISLIGNEMSLDDGIGTCGKEGQGVPVGVGQPTLLMGGITVGGTDTN